MMNIKRVDNERVIIPKLNIEIIKLILYFVLPFNTTRSIVDMNIARDLLEHRFGFLWGLCINLAKDGINDPAEMKIIEDEIEVIFALNIGIVEDNLRELEREVDGIKSKIIKTEEFGIMNEYGISAFA